MLFHYQYGFLVWMKNSVDPDQLASSEASWSWSTWFSKDGIVFLKIYGQNLLISSNKATHIDLSAFPLLNCPVNTIYVILSVVI